MTPFRTILFPTDFLESSNDAFGMACSLARDYGARLIIFNALEPPFTHGRWTVELPEDHARLMMERLRQFRPCARTSPWSIGRRRASRQS